MYLPAFALILLFFINSCIQPGDDLFDKSEQETGIIFTRIPHTSPGSGFRPDHSNTDIRDIGGTNIYKLYPASPSGELTNLTGKYTIGTQGVNFEFPGAALDPELSRDNTRLLFSMRKGSNERGTKPFNIYELNLVTGELLQLTGNNPALDEGDNFDPTYLNEEEVDIVFTSTRTRIIDEYERRTSPLLHIGQGRGEQGFLSVKQISFNQSFDQNPIVHSSGKIYFCRWEHLGNPNKMPIFTINADGSGLFVLYGNHSPKGDAAFLDMSELKDGRLVAAVMERGTNGAGGAIALLNIEQTDNALTYITPGGSPYEGSDDRWIFKTPRSMMDRGKERIVVAAAQGVKLNENHDLVGNYNYGIYVLDKQGGEPRLLWDDPNSTDYDPIPIQPSTAKIQFGSTIPKHPLFRTSAFIPSVYIDKTNPTGYFFTTDVTLRSNSDGQLNKEEIRGKTKYMRILEAISISEKYRSQGSREYIGSEIFEKQRVLGYSNLRKDNSFSIEVPANVAMHMQVLDENGMSLVSQRTWVQVLPGERRVCTGCHNSHDQDKAILDHQVIEEEGDVLGYIKNLANNSVYASAFNNAEKITAHPAVKPDTLDFADRYEPTKPHTVQMVLNRKCTECHNPQKLEGGINLAWNPALDPKRENGETDLNLPTHVFRMLVDNPKSGSTGWVVSESARNSPLMWVLYNKNLRTNKPLDKTLTFDHSTLWARDSLGVINPFLPQNRDVLTLIEWIDAGAQYSNSVRTTEVQNKKYARYKNAK